MNSLSRPERTELERLVQELEFRTTVTAAMLGTLDLRQVLYVILSGITSADGLGYNRAFLFLEDEQTQLMRISMAMGPHTEEAAKESWQKAERDKLTLTELLPRYEAYHNENSTKELIASLENFALSFEQLEKIALSQQQLIIEKEASLAAVLARCLLDQENFSSNRLTLHHELAGAEPSEGLSHDMLFRHFSIVPLHVQHKLIGAILADNIYTKHSVESDDLRRLNALGNLAALAIDRARLHAKTVAMAEVDGLTGVYNRRFYENEVVRVLEYAHRQKKTLSIIVFDIDFFKKYNDTYGHLVGDQLLKEVGRLLTQHIRASDIVARYGGEEFVVLLSDTVPEAAAQVAEKLRQMIKNAALASGRVTGMTLSAGVAGTVGLESADELFSRADKALYQAKAQGRDCVVVFNPATFCE